MSYAALLLDLDGTLVDSEPRHFVAHERFLASVGILVTFTDFVGHVGKGDRAFYRSLCARQGVTVDLDDWVQRKTNVLMQIYRDDGIPLRPGVHDLLGRAAQRGIFAQVVTSAERQLAAVTLEVTGLAARLPARICHEDVAAHKPNPEPYLLACQRLGVPPARCLVVEDSLSGVRAGVAAGCTVVGFPGIVSGVELRAVGAHRIVDSLAEVAL